MTINIQIFGPDPIVWFVELTATDLMMFEQVLRHTDGEAKTAELLASALQAIDDPRTQEAVTTFMRARGKI